MRPRVSVLITDLDNTLFDWVEIWYQPFNAMLEKLVSSSNIPRQQLINEIRTVHQKHGTSEYAFLIEELPSLQINGELSYEEIINKYNDVIHAYRTARKKSLKLYPSVLDTLKVLKTKGVLIVAYTESMAFYTNYRMRNLGLDGVIDYLYSPKDHDLPKDFTPEQARKYPAQFYEMKFTEHRHTPIGELKPNPKVLLDIISEIGAFPHQCLYVGDSLMKDVAMAREAGVFDVHALYGTAYDRKEYELLRQVSHWLPEQVENEKDFLKNQSITATYILEVSFSEILAKFDFLPFYESPSANSSLEFLVDVWKKVVDVQQHFNDIEMKIRNVAISVLGAFIGLAGYTYKEPNLVGLLSWKLPLSTFILWVAILPWAAFYLMDRWWYHRLLHGAVKCGEKLEDRIKIDDSCLDLTKMIGKASPINIFGINVHSKGKMDIFYGSIAIVILLLGLGLLFSDSPRQKHSLTSSPTSIQNTRKIPPTSPPRIPR